MLFPLSHANAQSESRRNDDLRSASASAGVAHASPTTFLSGGQLAPTAAAGQSKGTIQSPSSLLTAIRNDDIRAREGGLEINLLKPAKCDINNSNRTPTASSSSSSSGSGSSSSSGSQDSSSCNSSSSSR